MVRTRALSQLELKKGVTFQLEVIVGDVTYHLSNTTTSPDGNSVTGYYRCFLHGNVHCERRCRATMTIILPAIGTFTEPIFSKRPASNTHAVIRSARLELLENSSTTQPFDPFDLFLMERLTTIDITDVRGSMGRYQQMKAEFEALPEPEIEVIIVYYYYFQIFRISFTFLDDIYLYLLYLSL